MSPEEDRTRDAVDSEPKHYQLSYSGPHSSHDFQLLMWLAFSLLTEESDRFKWIHEKGDWRLGHRGILDKGK